MSLLEIRKQFIKLSGRNDLVVDTTDYVDNGANFYINAGQRYLDRKYRFPRDTGIYPKVLAVGAWHVTIPYCRAIQAVWRNSNESRNRLEKLNVTEFLDIYNKPLALETPGTPTHYCPIVLRSIPDTSIATIETLTAIIGYMPTLTTGSFGYNGLLIGPPTDEAIHIDVHGLFYTMALTNDTDDSFWSYVHPEVLLFAALYELEVTYRNTQGANDWLAAIESHSQGIDQDTVEEDAAEVDQMEG